MPGPLSGIRVVDFSAVVSGPLAAMILADQGADVVKVESPDRADMLRREWYSRGGLTSLYANVNRGKRCVALDLQDDDGLEAAHALCRQADVVVENYRPGVAERLKIGPEDLHAINPGLVYCRVTGYGPDEVLGRNCRFLQGTDRDQSQRQIIRQALLNRRAVNAVVQSRLPTRKHYYDREPFLRCYCHWWWSGRIGCRGAVTGKGWSFEFGFAVPSTQDASYVARST